MVVVVSGRGTGGGSRVGIERLDGGLGEVVFWFENRMVVTSTG